MLQSIAKHIEACRQEAAEARRRADEAIAETDRKHFASLEQSWRSLAESYLICERIERFMKSGAEAQGRWNPVETAPFDRLLELAAIEKNDVHAVAFPCRRILGGWLNADTKKPIEVRPTHWRDWKKSF